MTHPALSFGPPEATPTGPSCLISWQGQPIARLYRTDTPETDAWEPGMPGPVRVPGFTCYTIASLRTSAMLSSMHRDAVIDQLIERLTGAPACTHNGNSSPTTTS